MHKLKSIKLKQAVMKYDKTFEEEELTNLEFKINDNRDIVIKFKRGDHRIGFYFEKGSFN